MSRQLLHTPEGVRDIYSEECARKLAVEKEIQNVFHLYGYENIETPAFEFFDIFKKERGSVGTREMYKFFDRSNNTLVLRPDMTPPIARCVAKYFMEETVPLRLCYLGPTFINSESFRGRLNETTQTGVELIGDDSCDADAEMIAMVIHALKASGLERFQVELGQMEFYRGLAEEAGMDEETSEELRELIEKKNFFGVEELIGRQPMDGKLKQVFLKLPELFGDITQIRLARAMTSNPRALKAINRLEEVQKILDGYGLGDYVSYDLGMLSKYTYYTGIIFKAYTYGTGEYLVTGGRYDKLLVQFGKDVPAVGFAIVVDQLMLALSRQKIEVKVDRVNTMLVYEASLREAAIRLAGYFRERNLSVQMICLPKGAAPDASAAALKPSGEALSSSGEAVFDRYCQAAARRKIRTVLSLTGDGSTVVLYDVVNGHRDTVPYTDYIQV